MATTSENISSTPLLREEKPEGYENKPLREKVGGNPIMEEYDRVLRENPERVNQRKFQQTPRNPEGSDEDQRKQVKDFFEEKRRAAEVKSKAHANEEGQVEKMSEEDARKMAKSILRQRGIGIDRIAAKEVEEKRDINSDLSNYDPSKSTEEYDLKAEIEGALGDLSKEELEVLRNSNFNIATKGEEVWFPVYMEETNTLDVGFLNTGEDILNAIRNTVLPYLKDKSLQGLDSPRVDEQEKASGMSQLDEVEKVTNNTEQTIQNPEKERILQELGDIRKKLADANVSKGDFANASIENSLLQKDYSAKKEELADLMKREILGGEVGPLTAEQQKEFNAKFNNELYQFLNNENDSYNTAIKEARGVTFMDKVKEKVREVLGTKTVQWYLGQNRYKRVAMNTALFSAAIGIGTFASTGIATAAAGAAGLRVARGVMSFAGATAGMKIANNRWNPETIEAWKKEEEEKIMNSEDSIEDKSQKIEELRKEVDKRMKFMALKKAGLTAGLGAGLGIGTGIAGSLFDSYYNGTGGGASEGLNNKVNTGEQSGAKITPSESSEIPKMRPVEAVKPESIEVVGPESLQEIFGENYKEAMLQNVPKEGSLWGITREALLNNERFAALSVGQKNNILAYYSNKILNSPEKFGFEEDPKYGVKLEVGKPVDLSEVFDDKAEFEKVLSRAERMSPELEAQEVQRATEIENSYKVKDVMSPDTSMKVSVPDVSEIENPKFSDTEGSPVANKGMFSETERAAFMSGSLDKIDKISEKINQLRELGVDLDRIKVLEDKILELKNSVNYVKDNYTGPGGRVDVIDDVLGTSKKIDGLQSEVEKLIEEEIRNKTGSLQDSGVLPQREELENDIEFAKRRLEQLEKNSKIVEMPSKRGIIDPDSLRTMKRDVTNAVRNINNGGDLSSLDTAVERAFYDDVQRVYGSDGFIGLGKVVGVNSKDWGLMRGLSASEVVKYFTDDSTETKLPPNIVSELTKSAKHQAFGQQIKGLIDMTEGNVKPYENENMSDFTKRLGKFVMEKHSQGISNIKSPMKMAA